MRLARGVVALDRVRWVGLLVWLLACGSSSSGGSPNKTPGQCVLSNGVWYCGGAYGNYPDCPATAGSCDTADAGACFSCLYESAGATCQCLPADGGGYAWECIPSGTGCTSQ